MSIEIKSRKSKKTDFTIPKTILFYIHFLRWVSPKACTKFILKIFFTPISFKTPEREKVMQKSAKNILEPISSINKEVNVYEYGYSKRKILLVHGWSGRGTQLYTIADKLLEKGFMVITFDAPAHGKSIGKETSMSEFIDTIIEIDKKYGPFEAAIGHSLGGMSVLNAFNKGVKFKKIVSISAGDRISDILLGFIEKLKLPSKYAATMKKELEQLTGDQIDHYDSFYVAKNIDIPTLIIHDIDDQEIPVSAAQHIRKNLKNGSLLITEGLGHRKILKDFTINDKIVTFLNN